MTLDLSDALDKLRWAKHHFDCLRHQIEPFEQRDAHRITLEVNADAGEYVFYVHNLEEPDPDWGLLIGDCLHNARTALDYLMVRLWALAANKVPKDIGGIAFPIYDSPARFAGAPTVTEVRKCLPFGGYLARIEELQTYNIGNVSIWGAGDGKPLIHGLPTALQRLSRLDNMDKHRVVHATWARVDFLRGLDGVHAIELPPGFVTTAGSVEAGPLKDGAEIGRWNFVPPLPQQWQPSEVEMQRSFPLHVAIDDGSPFYGVLEVLDMCLWGVESVLAIFAPVFDGLQPPLPVTAIPNIE